VSQELWNAVDRYYTDALIRPDPALDAAQRSAVEELGWKEGSVSPAQGMLLHLLAKAAGAKAILEIGALAGYSTIWLARALPHGGRLVTLEADPEHVRVTRNNVERAGLAGAVEVVPGPALDSLPGLTGPFDFVFLDADKEHNAEYLQAALRLSRPGTLIVADNVVRHGAVVDPDRDDPSTRGTRRLAEVLAAEPRVSATAIQTVGSKGWDGFVLALVS
jgi:predicted O-methyltransferase YrrM